MQASLLASTWQLDQHMAAGSFMVGNMAAMHRRWKHLLLSTEQPSPQSWEHLTLVRLFFFLISVTLWTTCMHNLKVTQSMWSAFISYQNTSALSWQQVKHQSVFVWYFSIAVASMRCCRLDAMCFRNIGKILRHKTTYWLRFPFNLILVTRTS